MAMWKETLGPHRIEDKSLKLTAIRKVIYKAGIVEFLAKRGLYNALTPNTAGLEKYYEERQITIADVHPFIDNVEVSYRVDPVETKRGKKSE